jgi:hypothetical protein
MDDVTAVTKTVVEGIGLYLQNYWLFEPGSPPSTAACHVKPLIPGCQYLVWQGWQRQHTQFPKSLLFPQTTLAQPVQNASERGGVG